ncbi:MAG: caspase family protein [Bacteroidales bacterium]
MRILTGIVMLIFFSSGPAISQQLVKNFGNNNISTTSLSFSPDGKYLITGGFTKSFELSGGNIDFRTVKKDTETQSDYSFEVCASPDGRAFLLTKMRSLEIWDMQGRSLRKTIRDNQLVPSAAGYSKDGSHIVYMKKNGEVVFVNTTSYAITIQKKITGETPTAMVVLPDGKHIVAGTKRGSIVLFNIDTRITKSVKTGSSEINRLSASSSEQYLAASMNDGRIWLGKYPSLDAAGSWQAHSSGNTVIHLHPSGKYLASGGKDKLVRIWNLPEGHREAEWEAHRGALFSIAFSPDGKYIASGSKNDVISRTDDTKLWSFSLGGVPVVTTSEAVDIQSVVKTVEKQEIAPTGKQKRLALVIGNGRYGFSPLANPENDARAMQEVLSQSGFDVIKYENLDQRGMKQAMDEFGEKLKGYDVALFFYAGHGIQSKGYNYLIPVDANLKTEAQVEYDCVAADRVLAMMESAGTGVNIIILDACRNNPFERAWIRSATGRGLAFMNAPRGSLIAYATAPGSTASDGEGKNGLYTSAILESIEIPNLNILQVFQNVRSLVSEQSGGRQVPWESTSLVGDFYF